LGAQVSHRFAVVRELFAQSATRSELGEKYVFARITIRAFSCNYCVCLFAFSGSAPAAELTFWSMWNDLEPQAKALQTIMGNYTKAHPETTFKAVWNGRQNQTKLRGALQAGTPIDFMDQDGDQLAGGLQKEGLGYQLDGEVDDAFKGVFLPGAFDIYSAEGKH
jgi:raffinose/stachyose/melibiose transport system substrate-binding protein